MAISAKLPKTSTNTVIVLAALTVIIMLVVLLVVGRSFIKQIGHNGAVISKKQKAQTQLGTNLANLPGLADAYQNLGSTTSLVADALPTKADFPAIVATMEAISGASGVGLTSVNPAATLGSATSSTTVSPTGSADTSTASPQPYGLSIAIKGNYASVVKFLGNLQLSARPIVINGIQLAGTTNAVTGTVTATTYFYSPEILADKTEAVK